MIFIRVFILFFSIQLSLGAVEIKFEGLVNDKDFTLHWSDESREPILTLERGRDSGYIFKRVDGRWVTTLPGEHNFYLNVYQNNGHTHLVLMEARREKFHFYAWSLEKGKIVHQHDLVNIANLPVAESLDSSQGLTFDFKKVLRVPYTDKFFSFTHTDSEYLKCLYLGKLMGEGNDEETCLRFERFAKGVSYFGAKDCRAKLYNESLSFHKVVKKEDELVSCLNLTSTFEQSCLRNYFHSGKSLQNCLVQEKLANFDEVRLVTSCETGDSYCQYHNFLKRKLSAEADVHFNYDDLENNRTIKISLPLTRSFKLSLSHCYFQFLSTKETEIGSVTFASEAYDSCRASFLERQERPTTRDKTYFAKWVVELLTGITFDDLMAEQLEHNSERLSYWLAKTFGPATSDKNEYAQFLLKRGFLERSFTSREREWRAPASVSQ